MEKKGINLYRSVLGGTRKEEKKPEKEFSYYSKDVFESKPKNKNIFLIIFLIIMISSLYFGIFYGKECQDKICFENHLKKCSKIGYTAETKDSFWYYQINGKDNEKCEIYVKLLQLKEGFSDMKNIEGLDMTCNLKLGDISSPQKDLDLCIGKLKEEMQKVVIERLHNYIITNFKK